MKQLWEILVPAVTNRGKKISRTYHQAWDKHVRELSGGLTIMPTTRGQWVHQGALFTDYMIPVRLVATREQIERVCDFTRHYYEQHAVMAYRISEEIIVRGQTS